MMKMIPYVLTWVLGAAVALPGLAGGAPVFIDPLVPGRAMVAITPTSTVANFVAAFNAVHSADGVSIKPLDAIASRRLHLLALTVPPDYTPAQFHALELDMATNPAYAPHRIHAELLYEGQAPEGKTGSTWVDSVAEIGAFEGQYALTRTGVPAAQKMSTGTSIVVAVLDTGIDATHSALANRIAPGGFNFITNSTNTADVGDGVNNDGDAAIDEMVGHGTFVAGLIAGVAPDAKLLPITVLNSDGVGDGWLFVKGIYHAIDRGVEVMNMSLSTTYDSMIVYDAIVEARNLGIAVVSPAGNFDNNNEREYPAMWDDNQPGPLEFVGFGVAATDDQDIKASFSNYDDKLFISAPGASLPAVGGTEPSPARSIISTLPGNRYEIWEGTSFSVPLVAGTVALVRAQHPEWAADVTTFANLKSVLKNSAVNISAQNPQFIGLLGVGRLNAASAVAAGPVAPALGDLNNDGSVNVPDLLLVISQWSLVHSSADLDGSGRVGVGDLLLLISNWG